MDTAVLKKFQTTRKEMCASLIERDGEVDVAMIAVVAGEHCLLIGPPGVAKSLICDSLVNWMQCKSFKWLMTKFTYPEEIFGSLDIHKTHTDKANGAWEEVTQAKGRNGTNKLQEAVIAFLDELFNGNSAILNTTLRIINERLFDDGTGTKRVPLRTMFAGGNAWPNSQEGGKELGAFFDRFLIRKTVKPVASARGKQRLLWSSDKDLCPQLSTSISAKELDIAHSDAKALDVSKAAQEAVEHILHEIGKEGVLPGDRRKHKAIGVARAAAYLEGASEVGPEHLEVLAHVLWEDPTEQPEKVAKVVAKVANPVSMKLTELLLEAEQIASTVTRETVSDMKIPVLASTKLSEVMKQLKAMPQGSSKVKSAMEHVGGELVRIKDLIFEKNW